MRSLVPLITRERRVQVSLLKLGSSLNSTGAVVDDLYNKFGSSKYKYYYSDAPYVVTSMRAAMKHFGIE